MTTAAAVRPATRSRCALGCRARAWVAESYSSVGVTRMGFAARLMPGSGITVPGARGRSSDVTPARGGGDLAQAELQREMETPSPGGLVVALRGKDEVEEVLPRPVPAALERHGHRERDLEIVAGPAAVEIELGFAP